ncbi:MAG: hypothetical protein MUO31_07985 [Thermodesulfovibrionales bacterium]|nr:hypothetical protein [Thermodesulfovibrionales bacterium]
MIFEVGSFETENEQREKQQRKNGIGGQKTIWLITDDFPENAFLLEVAMLVLDGELPIDR